MSDKNKPRQPSQAATDRRNMKRVKARERWYAARDKERVRHERVLADLHKRFADEEKQADAEWLATFDTHEDGK